MMSEAEQNVTFSDSLAEYKDYDMTLIFEKVLKMNIWNCKYENNGKDSYNHYPGI